jgi:hypothetical protein
MRDVPEHPFDLGASWHGALRGRLPDWDAVYNGYARRGRLADLVVLARAQRSLPRAVSS